MFCIVTKYFGASLEQLISEFHAGKYVEAIRKGIRWDLFVVNVLYQTMLFVYKWSHTV